MSMLRLTLICFGLLICLAAFAQDQRGKDGKYHDPVTGAAQPDECHSYGSHPCHCERTNRDNCAGNGNSQGWEPGDQCQTYCRKDSCLCRTSCSE